MLAEHDVEHGPVALYVGRLSREKNLDVVRAAWALVNATHPAASLVVVGDGPYASGLAGPNVVALGTRHGTELAAIFASADLFVFPSETETFGNVVIEAAASGVPSIVAAAGAAHELVIDGVTGDVIDGRDPVALARAIVRQLNDAGRRTRMGVAARKHANGYELATAVDTCWRAYHDVIAARRATAPTGAAPIAELVQLLERAS
jgi:glycosyltransferase involved in cell wall biosynthesis